MDYELWARQNRSELVKQIIADSGVARSDSPLALFMAGIPGAGKTEFIDRLMPQISKPFVRIDLDQIVERFPNYSPKNYYQYRVSANLVLEKLLDKCIDKKYDFVLDGTLSHSKAAINIIRSLKNHIVIIIYLEQDPINAWEQTKDRELVTKRGVSKQGFIDAYLNLKSNMPSLNNQFKDKATFVFIRKAKDHSYSYFNLEDSSDVDIDTPKQYTKTELEGLLQ